MDNVEIVTGILAGMGLAASCGLRVFLPLLVAGTAAKIGWLPLTDGFDWLASWPAILLLGVATVLEIGAFYVPWIDNLLDAAATPAAVAAGALLMVASLGELDPALRWTCGIIVGGGVAGAVQTATGGTRGLSTVSTAGLANPILATIENVGALLLSVISILLPLLAGALVLVLLLLVGRVLWRILRRRRRERLALGEEGSAGGF